MSSDDTMRPIIQQVARLARQTFMPLSQCRPPSQEGIDQLVNLTNEITAQDLNFDPCLVSNSDRYLPTDPGAPVTYISIFENHVFTLGIFVLRHGYALPLHDHPGMYGICKVIHGKLGVTSYSLDEPRPVPESLKLLRFLRPTIAKTPAQLDVHSSCCLSPIDGNFHEIRAVDGPAAFMDILAPPYNDLASRKCHYYEEVLRDDGVSWLRMIPQPRHFWCESAHYRGPPVDL